MSSKVIKVAVWVMNIDLHTVFRAFFCICPTEVRFLSICACMCVHRGQPVCSSTCYNTADKQGKQPCTVCSPAAVMWSTNDERVYAWVASMTSNALSGFLLPRSVAPPLSGRSALRTRTPTSITFPPLFSSWVKGHGCSGSAHMADWQWV